MSTVLKEKPRSRVFLELFVFSPPFAIGPGSKELYKREGFIAGDVCELIKREVYEKDFVVYYVRNIGQNIEHLDEKKRTGRTNIFHNSFFRKY